MQKYRSEGNWNISAQINCWLKLMFLAAVRHNHTNLNSLLKLELNVHDIDILVLLCILKLAELYRTMNTAKKKYCKKVFKEEVFVEF